MSPVNPGANTFVTRIELGRAQDLAQEIVDACDPRLAVGFRLASSFVFGTTLVLIFQKGG